MAHDVVIIGGGIVGCATAVHLLRADPGLRVVIVEPDPGYRLAATPRASGGVRQLFSCPENIALSQYTLEVIGRWHDFAGGDTADLGWRPQGYLFVAGPGAASASLAANLEVQRAHGVRAEWLEPGELADRFGLLATSGLGGAVLSPSDGWLDPSALLAGMRGAARRQGARLLRDRAVGFSVSASRIRSVALESGRQLIADAVVNAAGCWAPALAAQAGMPVPVEPMRRLEHQVETPASVDGLPFVKDPAGLAVRPQGSGLSVGLVDFGQPGGFDLSIDHSYFDRVVWPALVHRFPGLDELRLRSTTAGLYDQNRMDGNMIIGNWPGHLDNFYLACGLSGHGLMHAPGIGRALTELILHGEYQTIDLTRLGYQRVQDGRAYPEAGIR